MSGGPGNKHICFIRGTNNTNPIGSHIQVATPTLLAGRDADCRKLCIVNSYELRRGESIQVIDMFIKVCILSFSLGMIVFLDFPRTATALRCHNCNGARKKPDQDPTCSQSTHNCTGAENTCMMRILYRNRVLQTYDVSCMAEVDCKRFGGNNCTKINNGKNLMMCTACCTSDLCNDPKGDDDAISLVLLRIVPTESTTITSTSGQIQILPITCYLATLIGMWFGD
ncbi:hypothetical protein OS493_016430 [Desmophyllum pertusum]|uniref:Uncharacterized protein n=1 Tax=Desmophyllum pertusum TaxID=174260 RepID=A0A9W9ZP78_9CNID|nr:hypothetical protein OS493_016430 [Desmophyllum pertusum]